MYYFELLKELHKNNVKYLIVGGLAVNLYGVPRVTQDIDIIISLEKKNVLALCRTMKKINYIPRLPINPEEMANPLTLRDWIKKKTMKAFSFYHQKKNYRVVDIILVHPLNFNVAQTHKKTLTVRNIKVPLVSIDDLICMKQTSGRPVDISDIKMLKKAKKIMEEND